MLAILTNICRRKLDKNTLIQVHKCKANYLSKMVTGEAIVEMPANTCQTLPTIALVTPTKIVRTVFKTLHQETMISNKDLLPRNLPEAHPDILQIPI